MVQTAQPATQPEPPPLAPPPIPPGRVSPAPQFEQPPQKTGPCAGRGFDDFDFLVGDWEVFNQLDGDEAKIGEVEVEWVNDGCALLQRWTARNDYSPVSVFFFDR